MSFTDYTYFSHDLLELCYRTGNLVNLLNCMEAGPCDEAIAYLREKIAESWTPSPDLLRQVCNETGAWDDLDTVPLTTLIDRAISCSLPDEDDMWNAMCYWEYDLVSPDRDAQRTMRYNLALKLDAI
jgi:hypothetical protein